MRKRAPLLPKEMDWHPLTKRWWKELWRSPMAGEYLRADEHALFMLAVLINKFWVEPSTKLASEIRLQQQAFGLTPLDRRRLEWSVEQVEQAKDRRDLRRSREAVVIRGDDPRELLK